MNLEPQAKAHLQIVRKSNELIEARYRLSIWEQRLILTLLLDITSQNEDFRRYRIRVDDFAEMWNLDASNSLYQKVQDAADSLVSTTIQLSDDPEISEMVSWFAYVKYIRGSGEIELEFHSSLKPYLLQLKRYYTEYQFGYVANFKNRYTIRIYELLKMEAFKAVNERFYRQFTYEDLRKLLVVNENEYRLFGDFKKRVIIPSVKEICANTDLDITDVEYGKTGRKVTDITFFVTVRPAEEARAEALQLEIEKPPLHKPEHAVVNKLIELGFAHDVAKRYKTKYGVRKIERNIEFTLFKQKEGLVKDIPAYLNTAISNDLGSTWETQRKQAADRNEQQTKQAAVRESKADLAHLEKLAAMADVPLESLLKGTTNP